MSTEEFSGAGPLRKQPSWWRSLLAPLASLRLTVFLLGLLTFLVFVGTLAQKNHDVWYVVREGYFRVWIARLEFQTLPALMSVFHPNDYQLGGWCLFPGGYLIGTAMAINLLAAHGMRFRVSARGGRLLGGLFLLAISIAATSYVVLQAFDAKHDASISPESADRLWHWLRGGLAGAALTAAYLLTLAWGRIRRVEWFVLALLNAIAIAIAAWLLLHPEWQINEAGMRIVWQMSQSMVAGGMLLASCWFLFKKRAGIVLLHAGIAVLMAHELYTAVTAEESQMSIAEGETVQYSYDIRESELVLMDHSGNTQDRVVAIPDSLLRKVAKSPAGSPERRIEHEKLPVDLRLLAYYRNSALQSVDRGDPLRATQGAGLTIAGREIADVSGLGGGVDVPSVYVELFQKGTEKSLGIYLLSSHFDASVSRGAMIAKYGEQSVEGEGHSLTLGMRFRRDYKPYSIELIDFQFNKYIGTNKAKDYSSQVRLRDHENGADIRYKIWMNNPLRYRGETLYQADWHHETEAGTILQVVKNESWMMPYVACALVGIGMAVHFSLILVRFLRRRVAERDPTETARSTMWQVLVPVFFGLIAVGYISSKIRAPEMIVDAMPVHEFAALPVADAGRIKPYDTLARNLLQFLCERQEAPVTLDRKEKKPAAEWLLDLLSGRPKAPEYYVFRITDLELLESLDLPRRPGFFKYSLEEIEERREELQKQARLLQGVDEKQYTLFQQHVRELLLKRSLYVTLANSFGMAQFHGKETVVEDFVTAYGQQADLRAKEAARGVVPATVDGEWLSLYESDIRHHCAELQLLLKNELSATPPVVGEVIQRLGDQRPNEAYVALAAMLEAYGGGDSQAFGKSVASYKAALVEYQEALEAPANAIATQHLKPAERLDLDRVRFEQRYNAASPVFYASLLYLLAMLLAAAAWLAWPLSLGRSATTVLWIALIVHTLSIFARMYISGRPPITNLYDTLVFNGWAAVVLMLVLEAVFKLGIGNFVAATLGLTTLMIAHARADGDTFTVLQAVLDTQFWLTTHVISINLGYATTVLAGTLGIAYLVIVHLLGMESKQPSLARMIYGTLCFATLLSLVGTVLGGLWADDSWGRFWGWDPKENGALMIVLWNALALHARWGKMIGTHGLAMLVVFGNIITAWSWFGVNQLGQGLHNYGFDDELATLLGLFVLSQVAILVIGLLPWGSLLGRSGPGPGR